MSYICHKLRKLRKYTGLDTILRHIARAGLNVLDLELGYKIHGLQTINVTPRQHSSERNGRPFGDKYCS